MSTHDDLYASDSARVASALPTSAFVVVYRDGDAFELEAFATLEAATEAATSSELAATVHRAMLAPSLIDFHA